MADPQKPDDALEKAVNEGIALAQQSAANAKPHIFRRLSEGEKLDPKYPIVYVAPHIETGLMLAPVKDMLAKAQPDTPYVYVTSMAGDTWQIQVGGMRDLKERFRATAGSAPTHLPVLMVELGSDNPAISLLLSIKDERGNTHTQRLVALGSGLMENYVPDAPNDAPEINAEQIDGVLAHELLHFKRDGGFRASVIYPENAPAGVLNALSKKATRIEGKIDKMTMRVTQAPCALADALNKLVPVKDELVKTSVDVRVQNLHNMAQRRGKNCNEH